MTITIAPTMAPPDHAELRALRLMLEGGMSADEIRRVLRVSERTLYRRMATLRRLRDRHRGDDARDPDPDPDA